MYFFCPTLNPIIYSLIFSTNHHWVNSGKSWPAAKPKDYLSGILSDDATLGGSSGLLWGPLFRVQGLGFRGVIFLESYRGD